MADPSLKPGDAFERYRIDAFVGRGGMGEVYRAFDSRLKRAVALKLLRRDDGGTPDPEEGRRLLGEARALAALSHPHVVTVHDVSEHQGVPYFTMELLDGQSLRHFIHSTAGPSQKLRWLGQIASALAAAHRAGLIHRDVKPDNVMVTSAGIVKLLDFGIAKRVDLQNATNPTAMAMGAPPSVMVSQTATGALVGTPRYMSPEQLAGLRADARSDQYAWALVAYELLTGTLPQTDPTGFLLGRTGLGADVVGVIQRALARMPAERHASMDDIVAAIAVAEDRAQGSQAPIAPAQWSAPPAAPTGPPTAPTVQYATMQPIPRQTAPPGRSSSGLLVVMLLLVAFGLLVVGAAGAAVFALTGRTSGTTAPSASASSPTSTSTSTSTSTATATATATATSTSTATATATATSTSTSTARPRVDAGTAPAPTSVVDAGTPPKPGPVAHKVQITATPTRGKRLSAADVSSHVAAIHGQLAACFNLPDCATTSSYVCLSKDEYRVSWEVVINEQGKVQETLHGGGGIALTQCIGKTLPTIPPFPPFTRDTGEQWPKFQVAFQVVE